MLNAEPHPGKQARYGAVEHHAERTDVGAASRRTCLVEELDLFWGENLVEEAFGLVVDARADRLEGKVERAGYVDKLFAALYVDVAFEVDAIYFHLFAHGSGGVGELGIGAAALKRGGPWLYNLANIGKVY